MASRTFAYPLYPIICIFSAALVLCVLAMNFVRQSWNLGVLFLCFWLFWGNLAAGVNGIIWSDNADVKAFIYCDIVSRLQLVVSVIKPMATLIIARRLHKVAQLQSLDSRNVRHFYIPHLDLLSESLQNSMDRVVEWTLGLALPLLIAGPLYYVSQGARFQVIGGFGSRILMVFYRHHTEMNRFLQSNSSISRNRYFRILALASIDALVTLPLGVVDVVLNIISITRDQGAAVRAAATIFYPGWNFVHTDHNWDPVGVEYEKMKEMGDLRVMYFSYLSGPFLGFVVFGLFGLTREARAAYWRIVERVMGFFGMTPTKSPQAPTSNSPVVFRAAQSEVCNTELHDDELATRSDRPDGGRAEVRVDV
ncbi:unnamed protein product [Peniophora sp. CBMAI 1063]|nr:unnamed protein product [Peniophora sp. CBMAI 1063]